MSRRAILGIFIIFAIFLGAGVGAAVATTTESTACGIEAFAKDWWWSKDRNQDGAYGECSVEIKIPSGATIESATLSFNHGYSQQSGSANGEAYIKTSKQVTPKDSAHDHDIRWYGDVASTGTKAGSFTTTSSGGSSTFDITSFISSNPSSKYYIAIRNLGQADVGINTIKLTVTYKEVQEIDLGTIKFTEAPKTWTVDVPSGFTKVEIGHYSVGETTPNKYMGWNGYLKVNGELVWKFLSWNKEDGGHIQDYALGQEVLEPTGRDKYLDATSFFRAGSNTVTYYHYTEGDGIGVKLRIYSGGAASPAVTKAPTTISPPTTSPPTTSAPTTRPPTTPGPGPSSDKKYLYGGVVAIVLLLVVALSRKGKKPAEVKPEPPVTKTEPEVRQTFIEREKVIEREKIPVFVSKTLPSKCPSCGSPFAGKSGDACEYCGAIIRAENKVSGVE